MCGRYYIEDKDVFDFGELGGDFVVKTAGEIFPSDIVPVMTGPHTFAPMKWGFALSDGKLLINARSETAGTKPMFQEAMTARRCLIPASGYYEWQKVGNRKVKHRFFADNPLYLAACYRPSRCGGPSEFVILTRDATPALAIIHPRMPVIIPENFAVTWLNETAQPMTRPVEALMFEKVEGEIECHSPKVTL
jgi:putative SOS response-associated peptidase YedK